MAGAGAASASLAEQRVACGDFDSRREHRIVIACGARDGVIRLLHVTAVTSHGHAVKEEEAEESEEEQEKQGEQMRGKESKEAEEEEEEENRKKKETQEENNKNKQTKKKEQKQ